MNRYFAIIAILIGLSIWLVPRFFRGDKAKIHELIFECAHIASMTEDVQIFKINERAHRIAGYTSVNFSGEFKTATGQGRQIQNNAELIRELAGILYLLRSFIIEISNLNINVAPGAKTASADFLAGLSVKNGSPPFEFIRFTLQLEKIEDHWRIEHAAGEVVPK
jgi:hypothetical protein